MVESILFFILLGLLFFYERYIYKYYKKVISTNGEKVKYKLIFIFFFFLPFYDVIIGYSKIGLNILNEPTIQITEAGKKFKEDYLFFKRFLNQDEFTIEEIKLDEFIYKVIKIDNKYYALFDYNLKYELNKNIIKDKEPLKNKETLEKIKKDLNYKYPLINFIYLSYIRTDNKYYNYFNNELLLLNNFNFNLKTNNTKDIKDYNYSPYNKYIASYNNYLYPIHFSHIPVYYEQNTRIYTMNDYLIDSEYFNIKNFIISYTLICLTLFIYLLLRIKIIYIFIYIFFIFITPNIMSSLFFYKDIYFNKNELTTEELYINPKEIIKNNCQKIFFDNLNYEKEFYKFYKFYIHEDYKIMILNYYDKNESLKKQTCLSIYKKLYTIDSFFGYYNLYNRQ
jgi:hypothetical protein